MANTLLDWHVAVYCANEERRLGACLDSLAAALAGRRALVTVVLNGSTDGSLGVARAGSPAGLPIEIVQIPFRDKSNAINQFIHKLRAPARIYANVDGYAVIGASAFHAMEERLRSAPHAVAVTGVAANGRTMRKMGAQALRTGGVLHGQLHALRPEFLDRMTALGLRLPVGLYRGDGLLGSMAAHDFAPLSTPWDDSRIAAETRATFTLPSLSLLNRSDVERLFRRRVKQMQGLVENKAIASVICRSGYEALPEHVTDLIRTYLEDHGAPRVSPLEAPFQSLALSLAEKAEYPDPALLEPTRIAASN